jgi:hypothetical protein
MNDKRFVSLHGFFAFQYPELWKQETDEAGHYLFYNENGGAGVLRVMLLPNDFENDTDGKLMMNEIVLQNQTFNPVLNVVGNLKFISFVKQHDVHGQSFTVHYWCAVRPESVVLFAYTIQTAMRALAVPMHELQLTEKCIASFEWLHEKAKHD